jgi:hypothetical protein
LAERRRNCEVVDEGGSSFVVFIVVCVLIRGGDDADGFVAGGGFLPAGVSSIMMQELLWAINDPGTAVVGIWVFGDADAVPAVGDGCGSG